MADQKISAMTAASALAAADLIAGVQSGANVKMTPAQMYTYVKGATPCLRAHKNGSAQAGVADATATLITFGTEDYDVGGYFASNAWTPPAGKVRLVAKMFMTATMVAGNACYVAIYKDGALFAVGAPEQSILTSSSSSISVVDDIATGSNVYTAYAYVDTSAGTGSISGSSTETYFCGSIL